MMLDFTNAIVELQLDGHKFHVHQRVLSSHSPFFKAKLELGSPESSSKNGHTPPGSTAATDVVQLDSIMGDATEFCDIDADQRIQLLDQYISIMYARFFDPQLDLGAYILARFRAGWRPDDPALHPHSSSATTTATTNATHTVASLHVPAPTPITLQTLVRLCRMSLVFDDNMLGNGVYVGLNAVVARMGQELQGVAEPEAAPSAASQYVRDIQAVAAAFNELELLCDPDIQDAGNYMGRDLVAKFTAMCPGWIWKWYCRVCQEKQLPLSAEFVLAMSEGLADRVDEMMMLLDAGGKLKGGGADGGVDPARVDWRG